MPFAFTGIPKIRTNIPSQNAYNAMTLANREISLRQLRLSTGKRINNAGDDVSGYITSRALIARNGSLKAAAQSVGDATNMTNIIMDGLDSINDLVTKIKDGAATAASGALGSDEKIALAKAAFRMTQQIQTIVDSTVYGGKQLIDGTMSTTFYIGTNNRSQLLDLSVDMSTSNVDFNISSNNFDINSLGTGIFAGVSGLNLADLDNVGASDLGIFSADNIASTLYSLSEAQNNVNKVASYLGGISNRLTSQEDVLRNQITNYNAAISRIEDADVAKEQLELMKAQFLQQTSLTSLAQSNQNPQSFLSLIQG